MSLHPQSLVPEETARVARAAYPKGHLYLRSRDELETIYEDQMFAHLFPHCGQPAEAPWRLLLVCLMQFAEGLSDQQAADAMRGRLDWKYLLSLDLTDPGFDASVLCEFRQRLIDIDLWLRLHPLSFQFEAHLRPCMSIMVFSSPSTNKRNGLERRFWKRFIIARTTPTVLMVTISHS
jgi:transposase